MSSSFYSFVQSLTNSITSKYEIQGQISTCGLWKIYHGTHRTTQQPVAVFVFEKKSLDISFKRERGASKQDTEQVYELLKKEASNLAKLRHPSILQVVERVSESRSSIVFATEPLTGTLAHLVKKSQSYSSEGTQPGYDMDELEIQKGLLQVAKGLAFLNDAKVVHHNLNPDAVFVNAKGDWKIGGLGFSVFLNQGDQDNTFYEYIEYLPEECQIDLDYAAPEFVLNNDICQANDMFALGCLAYTIHNSGVSLLQTFNNLRTYENKVRDLSSTNFKNIPVHLQEVIRGLLARSPTQRTSVAAFQRSKYFDNILVSTMKFLECFPEKSREEKSQFMKGLARVLNQFPDRVLKRKILPSLLEELKDHQLLPYTVPNIFLISEKLSEKEFCDLVLPGLKPVFSVRDPPQHMIVLLERLDALQAKTPREVFRDDIMPLVYSALENPSVLVQEKAMRIVPSLCESLDYTTVKNSLFPRIQNLFIKTTVLSVKVSTLICFHSMIKVIDKYTMQEKMVPLLKNIKTKEPAVMLATLAVYDEMGKHLDKEIVATEILPQLWRMSFGPLLNVDQFQKFMRTIRELTNRVEEAHTRHLQEVKSLEAQTRNVTSKAPTTENVSVNNNDDFESLVQGSSSSSDPFAGYEDHATSKTNGSGASKSIFPDDLLSTGSNSQRSSILMPSNGTNDWGSATSSPTRPTFANTTTPLAATQPVKPLAPPTNNNGFSTLIPTTTTATTVNNNRGFFNGNNTSMNSSFSSTPALQAPPSSTMASLSLQPTPTPSNTSMMTSGPNYNVLRGVSQPLMHMRPTNGSAPSVFGSVPLNPTNSSSPRHSQSSNPSSGHKATNLKLFDPLG